MTGPVPITPAHLAAVAKLEQLCFADPWSENALQLLCRPNGYGVVCPKSEESEDVLAYAGMTYALDEGSVTNVAVHPDHRRQGLGRAVVCALAEHARLMGIRRIYLEVRISNEPAIVLYRSLGFDKTGVRPNFYRHPTEHALLMCLELGESTEYEKDA